MSAVWTEPVLTGDDWAKRLTAVQQTDALDWLAANSWDWERNVVISAELDTVDIPLIRLRYWPKDVNPNDFATMDDDGNQIEAWPVKDIALIAPLPDWWQPA